jgi:hypothetical protein
MIVLSVSGEAVAAFILIMLGIIVLVSLPATILVLLVIVEVGKEVSKNDVAEAVVKTDKAVNEFQNSKEGQIAGTVLRGVLEYYSSQESESHAYTKSKSQHTPSSSSITTEPARKSGEPSFDRNKVEEVANQIENQGVDPYQSREDADIEELIEDIEQDGTNWK